ncbi:hypothetical protein FB107DRAFT_252152 [Schizophyllum commune]
MCDLDAAAPLLLSPSSTKSTRKWYQMYSSSIQMRCIGPKTIPCVNPVDVDANVLVVVGQLRHVHVLFSSSAKLPKMVVRKGLNVPLSIKKTQKKGWALFNGTQAIPAGHYVGSYVGEVLTATEADERERQYCASDRRYLFPLDFHYLTKAPRNSKLYEQSKRVIDSKRAGNYTRYLNHSCEPNLIAIPVYTEEDLPRIAFFTSRIIRPEEELCISYSSADIEEEGSEPIEEADRCHCGASSCKGPTDHNHDLLSPWVVEAPGWRVDTSVLPHKGLSTRSSGLGHLVTSVAEQVHGYSKMTSVTRGDQLKEMVKYQDQSIASSY